MNPRNPSHTLSAACRSALLAGLLALPLAASAALTDISNTPLSGASSMEIKPNIVFIMDDSLSMEWDYLPDWANVNGKNTVDNIQYILVDNLYKHYNSSFNGIAYNPAITYVPPRYFDESGNLDESVYPSQDKTATKNWTEVKKDGYGILYSLDTTVNLTGGNNYLDSAFYYTIQPGEFCTDRTLKNCATTQDDEVYKEPARLRWCDTADNATAATPAVGKCQAINIEPKDGTAIKYISPRLPAPRAGVVEFGGFGSVSSIKVDGGKEILSAPTNPASTLGEIVSNINACTYKLTGNCEVVGYSAKLRGTQFVMIRAPGVPEDPAITVVKSGLTMSPPTPFGKPTAAAMPPANAAPGENLLTVITPTTTTYPKAASRTDCAEAASCSYEEEMTNYANWYAYYRTRMQTMKTAASRAFEPIDDKYRIGYFSINNVTGHDFQNVSEFSGAQKHDWYDKLFAAKPGANTPLRIALSDAGRLYAGKLSSLNDMEVIDPMQYYCQPNVAILSTDGYWNEGAGYMVDGMTPVGNQDGPGLEDRPQLDAGAGVKQKYTLWVYKKLTPTLPSWGQKKVEQWQERTMKWQKRTEDQPVWEVAYLQSRLARFTTYYYPLQSKTYSTWARHMVDRSSEQTELLYEQIEKRQKSESRLQTWVRTKWKQEQHLETRTIFRNKRIDQLQRKTTPILESTDGGLTWKAVMECTQGGQSKSLCDNQTSVESSYEDVLSGSCVRSVARSQTNNQGTDEESMTFFGGVDCVYKDGTFAQVSSCKEISRSNGPTYTVLQAVKCQNSALVSQNWTETDSCAANAETGVECRWGPVSPQEHDELCVEAKPNNYGGPIYRTCTVKDSAKVDVIAPATCTQSSSTATGTVLCGYTAYDTVWTDDSTCTAEVAQSEGPVYSVQTAKKCDKKITQAWKQVTSCTPGTDPISGQTTSCQFSAINGVYQPWHNVDENSCTPSGGQSGGTYTGPWVQCAGRYTDYVPEDCDVSSPDCTGEWSDWSPRNTTGASSCTPVKTNPDKDTAGDRQCQYGYYGAGTGTSCTPVGTWPAPANDFSLSVIRTCSSPEFVDVKNDQTSPHNWANVPSGQTCVASGVKQCRYTKYGTDVYKPKEGQPDCPLGGYELPDGHVEATPALPPGEYDKRFAYNCYRTYGDFVDVEGDTCEDVEGPPREVCNPKWADWVDNFTYNPDDPPEPQPLKEYRVNPTPILDEWPDIPGTNPPGATPTDPAPTKECIEGTVNGQTTTCEFEIPRYWDGYVPPTWPRPASWLAGDSDLTACRPEKAADSDKGVETTCQEGKTGPEVKPDCVFNQQAASPYTLTWCTAGAGEHTPDTLADVAEYYWKTDLRTEGLGNCTGGPVVSGGISVTSDVCANSASTPRQMMSTYTLGLGVSGVMQYQADYKTATGGDFFSVKEGTLANPDTGVCSWQDIGECNWPKPISNKQTTVDDLWHAAVNGRGTYFSADNPSAVAAGISTALQEVTVKDGSLASVTVSSPILTEAEEGKEGDSAISAFQVSFSSGTWTGEVLRFDITSKDGVLAKTPDTGWSARDLLDGKAYTSRKIYTFDADASLEVEEAHGKRKDFTWDSLDDDEKKYFKKPHINALSQLCGSGATCLPAADHDAAQGENLVNFLRGDRTREGQLNDVSTYFRQRASALGDIVGSEATYVGKSPWSYADYGYGALKKANETRAPMVYVGANDGMLHAFKAGKSVKDGGADGGQEAWAYVPGFLLPDLYRLADKNYSHRYFVDGTPVMGDICVSDCGTSAAVWRTILVGGANLGGRGYYALDITDPANPKGLWEFTNENLGYSFGNPVITKLANGTWVVLVASGYNNVLPGDGKGHLFVLNAKTGSLIHDISTGEGDGVTPSGLAKISAFANYPAYNNTALRVYGGDLLGNLWRFDINGTIPPEGREAVRLATLKDAGGDAQPITTRPELGSIEEGSKPPYPVVFVGTGQLLGASDTSSTGTQSVYAIKEDFGSGYGNPRASDSGFVQQTLESGVCPADHVYCTEGQSIVKVKNEKPVVWEEANGWYIDFPVAGERVNTSLRLVRGTLEFITNTPKTGACVNAGVSFAYSLNYRTGGYIEGTDGVVGLDLGDHLSSAPTIIQNPDGSVGSLIQGDGSGKEFIKDKDVPNEPSGETTRRISWRELIIE